MKIDIISYDTFEAVNNLRTVICALCGHRHFDYGSTWTTIEFSQDLKKWLHFNPRIKFSKEEEEKINEGENTICLDRRKCIARQTENALP